MKPNSTSVSLLQRLCEKDQENAWIRFVEMYSPLIFHWARRKGIKTTDASDLVQEVLTVLVRELPKLKYDPTKDRFRGWLRTITVNKAYDFQRRQAIRAGVPFDEAAEVDARSQDDLFEEVEYRKYLVNRALELMKSEFKTETWQACWQQVVKGRKAADIAEELGLSINSVYLAKSRVLGRLREELSELMD